MKMEVLMEKKSNAQMKLSKLMSEMQNLKHAIAKKKYQIGKFDESIKKLKEQPEEVPPLAILQYLEGSGRIIIEEVKEKMRLEKKQQDPEKNLETQ